MTPLISSRWGKKPWLTFDPSPTTRKPHGVTKCPLCVTPVLAAKNCSKGKNAKTFLGSHRLRVANNVLFKGYFRCPYCSEPTELTVRSRHSKR